MLYYTNQELAAAHHVSVRTVRNWIESAKEGKLDLTLQTKGERTYIANISKNSQIISELVEKGKKFRPHRSQKTVSPQAKFYELYNQEQLYDIVSNLEIHREIPRQYNYFGEGADNWEHYANRLALEDSHNLLNKTIELLETNQEYLDHLLKDYEQVNVIDIGVGNAEPVKKFLAHLQDEGKLGRYIGIDISPTMLEIAGKNIKKWFGDSVSYEGYALDIDHDRFGNILAEEYIKSDSHSTSNLVLLLGGTINNFKKANPILRVIHDSMGVNDFYLQSQKLDSQGTRRYFDFSATPTTSSLAPNHRYIFDLLNIDESLYDVEMGYDEKLNERYIRVALKVALSIRFKFHGGERTISFNKDERILLWRYRQDNVIEVVKQLTEADLYPLQLSQSENQEYLLSISRIKRD